MNPNGDEKRIRQLFREMSSDERQRVPEFAQVLVAANSGTSGLRNRAQSLRFTLAVAMLLAALVIGVALALNSSKPRLEVDRDSTTALKPEEPPGVGGLRTELKPAGTIVPSKPPGAKRARSRRTPDRTVLVMKTLFAWQSPTASLLITPGDELLKSLPRLGESLQTIKKYSPEQFN